MKEHKVFIVPNQGKFGIEWMLAHTYPDLVKKVLPHFATGEREEPWFQAKCFELRGMLVQCNAHTSQSMVVAKHFDTNKQKNEADAFEKAITLYLESLVGLKYIDDQVIPQLHEQKKPAMIQSHCQILLYMTQNNFPHRMLNLPMPQELVEQLFLLQPKVHHAK